MRHLPIFIFAIVLTALLSSMYASHSEPTHLNIFYSDTLGMNRVYSIPFVDVENITFKNRDNDDSFSAIRILRRIRNNSVSTPGDSIPADTVPADTVPVIPIPNDTVPADTVPVIPIPNDTVPADTVPVIPIPNDTVPPDTIPNDTSEKIHNKKSNRNQDMILSEKIINMDSVSKYQFGTNVPTIRIFTDSVVDEVFSKKDYLSGYAELEGFGIYDDFTSAAVSIRGRGNSTWALPKKPYRLKFAKKRSLCNLASAKSFVLIANYLDATHLRNAMALKLSQLLEMPFANHSIPVNVELNGIPKGAYMLSEKQGIGKGSVDIDEKTGIMWELDLSYDEDYKFVSTQYGLPVMVADPDPLEILPDSISPEEWFESWKEDYERMEQSVKRGHPEETIDMNQIVDYLLVNLLAGNCEVDWPKSVKLFKPDRDSLYTFGPVWDFDWGFGYAQPPTRKLFVTYDKNLKGCFFFPDIIKTTLFMNLFKERWDYVKSEILPVWLDYMEEYADLIRVSALQDGELWPDPPRSSADFDNQLKTVREWIEQRIQLIDTDRRYMLY